MRGKNKHNLLVDDSSEESTDWKYKGQWKEKEDIQQALIWENDPRDLTSRRFMCTFLTLTLFVLLYWPCTWLAEDLWTSEPLDTYRLNCYSLTYSQGVPKDPDQWQFIMCFITLHMYSCIYSNSVATCLGFMANYSRKLSLLASHWLCWRNFTSFQTFHIS